MRIRIKTRAVLGYLITVCFGTVFFGIYFLSSPQLPAKKSRNGIERAARDSWSNVRHHERNSPLQFRAGLYNLQKSGTFSLHRKDPKKKEEQEKFVKIQKQVPEQEKLVKKQEQVPEQEKLVEKQEQFPDQEHVLTVADKQIVIPPSSILATMSWEELAELYHSYTQLIQVKCSSMERLGKVTDGGWEVCEDEGVKPSAPCLVYSFGVGDDFSFDDAVAKHYKCEVHSFDPSMKSKEHQRESSVHFHPVGLANFSGVTSSGWKMSTLPDIQKSLGHAQKELSVLKLDIEEWEWTVLPSLLKGGHLKNVRQLLMELHQCDGCSTYNPSQLDKEPPKSRYVLALSVLADLYDLGFRVFWQHQNRACNYVSRFGYVERNACCELHLVRMDQGLWEQ